MGIILKATNPPVCCFFKNIYCKYQSLADEEVAEVDPEKFLEIVMPKLKKKDRKIYIDIADCAKRSP